jgi:hypothetical protein
MDSNRPRIPLFFAIGIGLSLLMAALKAIAAGLAEAYLYSVPWVGGFLRSIELAEISNLLIFALLAGGIGAATFLLPHQWNNWAKIALLIVVSPFVFSASYLMQQHLWVQRVAKRADISYSAAKNLTNEYLKREAGSKGFSGFYPLSAEVSELPTLRQTLESGHASNPSKLLTQELAGYKDPRADAAAYLFERAGWLVRFMYMTIAALSALIYYFKGHEWAESKRLANGDKPNPPTPKPPTPKPPTKRKVL